jgi:hypothetical protein
MATKFYNPRFKAPFRNLFPKLYYATPFFANFLVLLAHKNCMLSASIIPYNLFEDIAFGIGSPSLPYTARLLLMQDEVTSGSRLLNIPSIYG